MNRTPDPGCGILEVTFDQGKPHWQGAWYDEYTGLATKVSDDLREVVQWAQTQPAERKVFHDVGRPGPVDLDKFVANHDRYLHEPH
ncbi:hypothetical protein [Actinopolymorpha rutila]|uniref:Uncharacterized protein n=1 Tax=Actinopolymorpha rutila TaxID=446787 RepID=A0A852ZN42_9ACTN|nr:hypothetical protein [Actinopolymorpha rutila]NYH92972.1 hypothetical protein [Actinopolymorpha rutila]